MTSAVVDRTHADELAVDSVTHVACANHVHIVQDRFYRAMHYSA